MVRAIAKVLGFITLSAFMGLLMLVGIAAYVARTDPAYAPPSADQIAGLPAPDALPPGPPQRYTVKASWEQGKPDCKPQSQIVGGYFSAQSTLVSGDLCAKFEGVYLTDKALIPNGARNVVLEPVDITK